MEQVRKQLYVPPEMDRTMKRICSLEKVSESEIMRRALEAYFRQMDVEVQGDPLLKTIGLGSSEGSGDGSTNHDDIYEYVR